MTYSSAFMSDLIRGIEASRPQVAEDWLFIQDDDSPRGALVAPVMWVATTTKVGVESTPTNAVKVAHDGKVCSQPREPGAQAWSDRAAAVSADRERVFPAVDDVMK